jgi:hypothetical protein
MINSIRLNEVYKYSPDLFSDWCCHVGILNVSHLGIQIIQILTYSPDTTLPKGIVR